MYPKTQAMIQEFQRDGIFSGAVYQLITPQRSLIQALGLAQVVPTPVEMTAAMRFDVASLTKVICTTTVVLQLAEKGRVEVDKPLQAYLPAFENNQITLRHLLTHTSDIQTYIPNRDQLDQSALRQAYYGLQPGPQLGRKVQYTDAGTILLGFMLEELFHESAVEIFQTEVLQPLRMVNSGFLPQEITDIVPTEAIAGLGVLKGITHDPKARVLAEHAGNAGLFTNLADLQIFTNMLLAEGYSGGQRFLQAETIASLLQDQTPDQKGGRSLGWDLKCDLRTKQPLLFHTGYTGTFLLIDIPAQEAFIFLSNRVHPQDRRQEYLEKRDQLLACYLNEKAWP